ncbi:MAG: cation transporter [Deltaproteobacteria bacterium]|nr:cation transporter [Deltaproteobacteria bacterium]
MSICLLDIESSITGGVLKEKLQRLVLNPNFDYAILGLIVLNCIVIGVELDHKSPTTEVFQNIFLLLFSIELILRWFGRISTKEYFQDTWNFLDIIVVGLGLVAFVNPMVLTINMSVVRIVRTFRVFRSLHLLPELRLMTAVLLVSLRSLMSSGLLFLITMYVYAVIGVTLFRHPDYASSPNVKLNPTNPDPYGDLGEAFFTLFRILTGEDWTDIRYNLLNQPHTSNFAVTFFHVTWMILAAYLLVNLVVGAILNNYDQILSERRAEEKKEQSIS